MCWSLRAVSTHSSSRNLYAEGASWLCLELFQTYSLKSLYVCVGKQAVWKHQPTASTMTRWSPPPVHQQNLNHVLYKGFSFLLRLHTDDVWPLPPSNLLRQAGSPGVPLAGRPSAKAHVPSRQNPRVKSPEDARSLDLLGPCLTRHGSENSSGEDAEGSSTCVTLKGHLSPAILGP